MLNVSDMSGSVSRFPHTILAASYLTGSSLKLIIRDCFDSAVKYIEDNSADVVNLGVDGESLHIATAWADGTPGTDVALAKEVMKRLKGLSKTDLVQIVSDNVSISIL